MSNNVDLDFLRVGINDCDAEIFRLLMRRADCVKLIGEFKKQRGLPIRDTTREMSQMKKILGWCRDAGRPELALFMMFAFGGIIRSSVLFQGDHHPPRGTMHCQFCKWDTPGMIIPAFDWPVCPSCQIPLSPK